ncbi:MAG: ABC-three component system protein [Chthonomonadales bacterium]
MNLSQFSATDSLLGYVYQFRYALSLAIDRNIVAPDHSVSIELLDDVAFETVDGQKTVVQTKHHQEESAEITDLSPDLWKSLRIWSIGIATKELDPNSCLFILATTSAAKSGCAASLLSKSDRDPVTARIMLLDAIDRSTSKDLEPSFQAFLSLDEKLQQSLLNSFYLADNQLRVDELRKKLEEQLRYAAPKTRNALLIERLEGWWFNTVINCLTSKPNHQIPLFAIDKKIDELRDEFGAENLPIDFRTLIPPEDQKDEFLAMKFVEQMRLVGANNQIVDAIKDYYRAFTQRHRWISDSLLYITDLEEYELDLQEAWEREFNWMLDELGSGASDEEMIQRGRQILKWANDVPELYIKPECTEAYVVRGNLHILSNDLKIGWHPEFAYRLNRVLESATK